MYRILSTLTKKNWSNGTTEYNFYCPYSKKYLVLQITYVTKSIYSWPDHYDYLISINGIYSFTNA